mgnify:CR=1 FL=1
MTGVTDPVAAQDIALYVGQLKVGSFARSERMAKWNELLRIEEAMGADAVFDKSREIDALVHWCSRQAVAAPWRERKPRRPHWIRPFLSA